MREEQLLEIIKDLKSLVVKQRALLQEQQSKNLNTTFIDKREISVQTNGLYCASTPIAPLKCQICVGFYDECLLWKRKFERILEFVEIQQKLIHSLEAEKSAIIHRRNFGRGLFDCSTCYMQNHSKMYEWYHPRETNIEQCTLEDESDNQENQANPSLPDQIPKPKKETISQNQLFQQYNCTINDKEATLSVSDDSTVSTEIIDISQLSDSGKTLSPIASIQSADLGVLRKSVNNTLVRDKVKEKLNCQIFDHKNDDNSLWEDQLYEDDIEILGESIDIRSCSNDINSVEESYQTVDVAQLVAIGDLNEQIRRNNEYKVDDEDCTHSISDSDEDSFALVFKYYSSVAPLAAPNP